jgi:hypothetical protein
MRRFEAQRERARLAVPLALVLLACSGPSLQVLDIAPDVPDTPADSAYLDAQGDGLVLGGEPFRFASLNAFTLTGCGNADELFDEARLDSFFASLRPRSLVRTYAFQTQRVADIEAVILAAARHEQLLTLVLTDANGSCGDEGIRKDEAWFASGFRESYLAWVRELVAREAAQPSIGIWELVSSPTGVRVETLRAFYDEVGTVVHQLAPHHLVSSGTHGVWAYGGGDGYRHIHESPGIDVASFRDYYADTPGGPPNLQGALDALAGSKPLILDEAGVFASPTGDSTQMLDGRACLSWDERRDVLWTWLDQALQTRLAGVDVWNYLPVRREGCGYSTHDSDPLFTLLHDAALP